MDIDALIEDRGGILLDIGCGANKQGPDWVGMDKQALDGVDIVHDWNDYPWPLPDECVLRCIASHVVEHVNPADGGFLRWMNELWRVMHTGGQVAIAHPHTWSRGYGQDPTHCNPLNEVSWVYFDPEHPSGMWGFYKPRPWKIAHLFFDYATNVEVVLVKREVADD